MVASVRDSVAGRVQSVLPDCVENFSLSNLEGAYGLRLIARFGLDEAVVDALPEIAARVERFLPLHWIGLGDDPPLSLADIRWSMPDLNLPDQPDPVLCACILREATRERSLFQVAPDGTYLQAWLTPEADPPMPCSEMVGLTLQQVVGPEAAAEILAAANRARAEKCGTGAVYNATIKGETRGYAAAVSPLSHGQFLLAVTRLR